MGNGCDIIITWGGAIFNMTNEELATAIQNGETELYPVLWEKIEKLIDRKAEIYALNLAICGRRLDPVEFKKDLKQSAYFALIAAVLLLRLVSDSGRGAKQAKMNLLMKRLVLLHLFIEPSLTKMSNLPGLTVLRL